MMSKFEKREKILKLASKLGISNPRYYCSKCGAVEYCDKHLRAEFPPDATKKALKKTP